ncbi:hypothetical protein YPC_2184 [Yersinia pestis biovar Medievalis str. Harbin 35]|nr:hypothetical protein YPC_2184 [Yersinia pestis biovar Medievalis str. Harbin 35]EEO80827.1 hypothetical protein YPF_2622 [Yersinia pestis biovar Orientalis str. India 195]EEO83934.1 hypothetical protein YPH_4581 [Yersinia pestis biovar Orientalis str. PEXU2]EIR49172.1 hypothetical protein YPPY14_2452 [Yersinia pestis PY-14]
MVLQLIFLFKQDYLTGELIRELMALKNASNNYVKQIEVA